MKAPLLQAVDLKTWFPIAGGIMRRTVGQVRAVDGVDLEVHAGEVVSVVGESGCGKSTLGYSLLGLVPPTSGSLKLLGNAIDLKRTRSWSPYRKDFQIVFQDPYNSLNPRHTVYEILAEPMRVHGLYPDDEIKDRVAELLTQVGLQPDYMRRFPHAFSGGQRQRIGIARAIGLKPKLLVCDEVVSALDVSVQAQIIELLLELKQRLDLALLFISHDLSLVKTLSDRICVMYLGRIVESGPSSEIFAEPRHPYTKALLDSIPTLQRGQRPKPLQGDIPSPSQRPQGCAFASRCPVAQANCREQDPLLGEAGGVGASPATRQVACLHPIG
jgi:oligopeptide/dipeptide ABC transporter ATP-binding protein